MAFTIDIDDSSVFGDFTGFMNTTFPDMSWEITNSDPRTADLIIRARDSSDVIPWHGQIFEYNVDRSANELSNDLVDRVVSGDLILPTAVSSRLLQKRISEEEASYRKLRNNNSLIFTEDMIPESSQIESTIELEVYPMHETALQRYAPKLAKILRSRCTNTLQRVRENWLPLGPISDDPHINEYYDRAKVPQSAEELRLKVAGVSDKLAEINLSPSKSRMDRTQLDLGVFFPGQFNRDVQGLTEATDQFIWSCEVVAKTMLRGLAYEVKERGVESVSQDNTRVGVKVANFQGSILATNAHPVRLGCWDIMKRNGNDIFYFKDFYAPAVAGFRLQDNPAGKLRTSHVLIQAGIVGRSKVADGEDLAGKSILHYSSPSDREGTLLIDDGDYGARARIIFNLWSGKNDSTLPVPAYIAHYKDDHYKAIFQQSKEIFNHFIPGTLEFEEFWRDGWDNMPWVQKYATERGLNTFDSFINECIELGEFVAAGDVENFDGNLVWNLAKHVFRPLLSDDVMYVMERMWNEDKIGCYVDRKGNFVFYLVKSNIHECTPEEIAAVQKTADMMSSFASGYGTTSQAGRICVPAVLIDIILGEFLKDCPELKVLIETMPIVRDSRFSFISALMNSAGDDHILSSLVLWLVTGIHPRDVRNRIWKSFETYTIMKISREDPPMNAGFYFHEAEDGRLIDVSLSDKRMFANTIYPERKRSAIGLLASTTQYVESAIDSPFEEKMLQARDIIVKDIYGFEDLEHLEYTAEAEKAWLSENEGSLAPAELLALQLNITLNDLEWKYSYDELLEMGADTDVLSSFRRPIPEELTLNPFRFLNLETVNKIVATL